MATPLMGYYAPSDGADPGNWGSNLNSQFTGYVDVNFAGVTSKTLSASNVTLSASECRNQNLRLTGALLANVTIDAGAGLWNGIRCVENLTSGSFSVTLSYNGTCEIPQGRRCLVFLDASNGPRIIAIAGSSGADPIPTGSIMPFYQAAPPVGWSLVTSVNNAAIRISNSAGGVTGGSAGFTSVFGARTPAGSVSATTVDVPPAGYTGGGLSAIGAIALAAIGGLGPAAGYAWMNATRTLATGVPAFTGTPMDFSVLYADMILCRKN